MVPQILHFLNLRTCESERFISNEIARSHKIVILLRTANFNLKNAVCLWKITEWKIYFFIFQKILLSFVQKGSRKKSDPFRSDPWFFGSTIRSRSSRRKWICDPITILKKEDLDPKGSRSDHDRHISAHIENIVWLFAQICTARGFLKFLSTNVGVCFPREEALALWSLWWNICGTKRTFYYFENPLVWF